MSEQNNSKRILEVKKYKQDLKENDKKYALYTIFLSLSVYEVLQTISNMFNNNATKLNRGIDFIFGLIFSGVGAKFFYEMSKADQEKEEIEEKVTVLNEEIREDNNRKFDNWLSIQEEKIMKRKMAEESQSKTR